MILLATWFLRHFAGKNVTAMALFPFILIANTEIKEDISIIHHERIHWRQQVELLLIFFYILYGLYYLWYRFHGMNHYNSYMSIPFEEEAYKYQDTLDYLPQRPYFNWIRKIEIA